jgi:3-phenylpropionate/trans-cinnamate dioxygenase ferredoxin subunit
MSTVTFSEALRTSDLKDGEMKEVNVNGHAILVAMVGGKVHAVSGRCPHMGARLAEGKLDGTVITCPRHGSQFDVTNGQVMRWTKWSGVVGSAVKLIKSPRPLGVYPVRVEGDKILVEA